LLLAVVTAPFIAAASKYLNTASNSSQAKITVLWTK